MWLPLVYLALGTWPATQACVLTGNRTDNPLVHRPALNPLSHTSQGWFTDIRADLHLRNKFHLIMVYDLFDALLNLVC